MPTAPLIWGDGVRARRQEQGLTQTELATKAKVSQASISRLELGSRQISDTARLRIAAALGADPYELFPYIEAASA